MADEDTTKDELQEELRRRDLPVSGTKDELEQRLQEEGGDEPMKKASKKTASKKAAKKGTKKQGASKKTASKKAAKKGTKKQGASKKASSKKASKKQTSKKQGTARMQSTSSQQETSDRRRDTSEGQRPSSESRQAPTRERRDSDDRRDGDDRREAPSGPPKAGRIARLAARQLGGLTRHKIEGISGIARDEDGWRVEVEVVEVHRVPPTTDVLGIYAVYVDRDGDLVSYERVERYVRGQASGGEG